MVHDALDSPAELVSEVVEVAERFRAGLYTGRVLADSVVQYKITINYTNTNVYNYFSEFDQRYRTIINDFFDSIPAWKNIFSIAESRSFSFCQNRARYYFEQL